MIVINHPCNASAMQQSTNKDALRTTRLGYADVLPCACRDGTAWGWWGHAAALLRQRCIVDSTALHCHNALDSVAAFTGAHMSV